MNNILNSKDLYRGFQRPIALTYYALVQALLIAAGGEGDELPALEPTCTSRNIDLEERKVKLMGLVVDILQSGGTIEQVVALVEGCGSGTIPSFTISGLLTPLGTITATVGAVTINQPSGTANIAAGQTSVIVTNSLVTANSIVLAVIRTNDGTAILKNVTPAAGSFTIRTTAAVTGNTSVGWLVVNPRS